MVAADVRDSPAAGFGGRFPGTSERGALALARTDCPPRTLRLTNQQLEVLAMKMSLQPVQEFVGADPRYHWDYPSPGAVNPLRKLGSVWYFGLPLTSAHRDAHNAGDALGEGLTEEDRYRNEGSVYPHASLVEMITYQARCFPDIAWRYMDMGHLGWPEVRAAINEDPPDVAAFSVYTATTLWAMIVAAEIKRVNPKAVVVFGNDHAGILYQETLTGKYGSRVVDFVSTGNNGPFTMMGLLTHLQGGLDLRKVPSLAYRVPGGEVVNQDAGTFPLNRRILPDYRLILDQLENHYDRAFNVWYAKHYDLKRMVTVPLDGGCTWGKRPGRRCMHCSIQGLTPKTVDVASAIPVLETIVGDLGANVYACGDSTLGFSSEQWDGNISYLNDMAEACAKSPILQKQRFMLAYGLVYEFLESAELCKGFVRTWNVGLEAFDPKLLKADSKGINKGPERISEALELARSLDYKLFASGIMGLPGTTMENLRSEVNSWLSMAETYRDLITSISVAPPGIIPGSRMYWESYKTHPQVRASHGEILPARRLTALYIRENTEVELEDVEAAITDLRNGIAELNGVTEHMKFGYYMLGGRDEDEALEYRLLDEICSQLD
ncbi:B12-binding domain-containing radical SAM protein [Micromonospora sp. DT178]|uniref:B12-binding domain-containing radical SAM protein n=1 Tax=Micromonospora sp. DT178 TaxID=3393436 RepID=UPI003CF729D4